VGHAGTLDPFATGLLVVLVGKATRLARFLAELPKRYDAIAQLGVGTDTDDPTGQVTTEVAPDRWPERDEGELAARSLLGRQVQRPPAYSAKHVAGTRSHVLARKGEAVELPPATVMVHELVLDRWEPPEVALHASVGGGTYVRALVRDLGLRLGLPAHCTALRRTAIGRFEVAAAIGPEEADAERLLAPADLLAHLPMQPLSDGEVREIGFGRPVLQREPRSGPGVLLGPDGAVVAVAEGREGRWYPTVVLEPGA
jgi:tRNA pseudouridine55 synthase